MFGPGDVRVLTAEPVELAAEPVEWPTVIAERERQRLVSVGGVDFAMMTPAPREGGKKEESPLAKKVGKVRGKAFGRRKE